MTTRRTNFTPNYPETINFTQTAKETTTLARQILLFITLITGAFILLAPIFIHFVNK